LFEGPLDIVGDVHGELGALRDLLKHLGYRADGAHPQARRLVFVGDLCDRGPDSPAVLQWVQTLVQAGHAQAVVGNHEINLMRGDAKDGAGWFFDERAERDASKYAPFALAPVSQRVALQAVASRWPVALERDDLRVVHAAWRSAAIAAARQLPLGQLINAYDTWEAEARTLGLQSQVGRRMSDQLSRWGGDLESPAQAPPFMPAHAENEVNKQMLNPLKVLTSGVEREGHTPFFAGGKWRFVQRVAWWDSYEDATPVVVGHYWRRRHPIAGAGRHDEDLFAHIPPLAWHGQRGNVFCVDYSVGGRWLARQRHEPPARDFKLAALQWPEQVLVFDDGSREATEGFAQPASA
jgi:hypothetical protein